MSPSQQSTSYPSETTSSLDRGADYYLAYAKAAYYEFTRRGPAIFHNRRDLYEKNRRYSLGMQSMEQYKKILDAEDTNPTYTQLSWEVIPVWPKFRDIILSRLGTRTSDVIATPIDALSQQQERDYRLAQKATIATADVAEGLKAVGVDTGSGPQMPEGVEQAMPMDPPKTEEELELFMQLAYKSRRAMAVEIGWDVVAYENDWREISRQLREDFLDCGVAVSRDYIDPTNGSIRLRRADPALVISGYSARSDFRYVTRMGELVPMSEADVLEAAGDTLTADQREKLANMAKGMTPLGGPRLGVEQMGERGQMVVLDLEWLGRDVLCTEAKANRYGGAHTFLKPGNYKAPKNSQTKRQVTYTDYEVLYKVKWVVGTDIVFDFGVASDMKREPGNRAKAHLNYTAYGVNMQNMRCLPFTSRVTALADDYQIARMKLQHLVASAKPKGIAVEFGSLNGVLKGDGSEFEPLELLRIYDQTGNIIYNRIDINGDPANGLPIQEVENGLARDTMQLINIANHALDQIRIVTGLNETADASAPAPGQLNGTTQAALQATNLALQPLYDADDIMLAKTARSVITRLQQRWKQYGGKSYYLESMGEMVLKALQEDPGMSLAEFGIKIEAVPSEEMKQQLEQDLQVSLASRSQTGKGGIELEDAMLIRRVAKGNLKLAEQYLVLKRKQRLKEDQEAAAQNSQMASQQAQASAQATTEAKQQELQMGSQLRIQEAQALAQIAEAAADAELERKLTLLNAEGKIKAMLADLEGDIKAEQTRGQIEMFDARMDHASENKADGPTARPKLKSSTKKK